MTQRVIFGPPPRALLPIMPAQVPDHVLNELISRASAGMNPEAAALVYAGDISVLVGEILLLRKDIGQALATLRTLPVADDASLNDTVGQVTTLFEPKAQAFWQKAETQRLRKQIESLEQEQQRQVQAAELDKAQWSQAQRAEFERAQQLQARIIELERVQRRQEQQVEQERAERLQEQTAALEQAQRLQARIGELETILERERVENRARLVALRGLLD